PLLMGPSRKSFIGDVLSIDGLAPSTEERGWGTAAGVAWLAFNEIEMVRVHEPREARDVVGIIRSIENGN
ncbi:MAG: dihydropteroate synthase, partial [Kiritimatiellaeota bacterium]|nr:dihydropteroate synthase [Kiritimatiellota bacterium]